MSCVFDFNKLVVRIFFICCYRVAEGDDSVLVTVKNKQVLGADRRGFQIACHAIGDMAIDRIVEALEKTSGKNVTALSTANLQVTKQ